LKNRRIKQKKDLKLPNTKKIKRKETTRKTELTLVIDKSIIPICIGSTEKRENCSSGELNIIKKNSYSPKKK
jgi:hypothetical protein